MEINSVIITGRLTKDPEVRYTQAGTAILKGSLATSRRVKHGEQWVDQSSFFDFDYLGKGAAAVEKYLHKGSQVILKGELKQERWEKDGQKNSKVVIFVESLMMIGGKAGDGGQVEQAGAVDGEFNDDIPF